MQEFITFGLSDTTSSEVSAEILGGKGAGLVWMSQQGMPVPPGFVIPTTVWSQYDKSPKGTMKEIAKVVSQYVGMLTAHFGYTPLLSVRSGARVSCPGMMDTILNVGLDYVSYPFWKKQLGDKCFVNSLHRLVTMYGSVVKGLNRQELEQGFLDEALKLYEDNVKEVFPLAKEQLLNSIEAVFKSWDNERALVYRKVNGIPREWGTAVTIQAMVFGNLNESSGTGVLFTRNPDSGEAKIKGEFLSNAQGEDVVAGIRTPQPLEVMSEWNPGVTGQLKIIVTKLEQLRKDVQDVEFTIQDGKLYILQTRNAKRSAPAAIKIALDMVKEGLLTKQEAVKRVSAKQFDLAQMPRIDSKFQKSPVFVGIPACSGVVTGKPVFSSADAINCKVPCILVTEETTPDDIAGMLASKGILTMKGGLTSHAAVVARGENVPCITGIGQSLEVFKEADVVSMDGATGRIWMEEVPIEQGETNGLIQEFSQMVAESLGVVPVLRSVPVKPMEQAMLVLGERMLNPESAAGLIVKMSQKVQKLYVDLTVMEGPEAEFFSICGGINFAQKVVDELENYLLPPFQEDMYYLKKKLVLVGAVKTKAFKQMGMGDDLRSLILADKELMVGNLSDDPAIKKVMEWKKNEGLSLVSAGKYVTGMKSMISVEQALQIVEGV